MSRDIAGPEDKSFHEASKVVGVLVYNVEKTNQKGGEAAGVFRDASVEYIDSYNLPQHPPEGVSEVFMDSGAEPKFRSKEHQDNWSGVTFEQLVHGRDGSWTGISKTERKQHASDFEVMQH